MAETIINRYYSLDAYLSHINASPYKWEKHTRAGWSKPCSDTVRYVRQGASDAEQKPVREMLAKIDAGVRQREKRELIATVAGGSVNVPDFLQGKPRCMRRRTMVESDVAPVRVVIEIGVSQGTADSTIVKRGAAVAALVMRLAEIRPVELWAAGFWMPIESDRGSRARYDSVLTMVRINTAPISTAEITATLVGKDFARAGMFSDALHTAKLYSYDVIAWAWDLHDSAARMARARKELNLADADILIPGGHLYEQGEMYSNPVAWVNKYLDPQREL